MENDCYLTDRNNDFVIDDNCLVSCFRFQSDPTNGILSQQFVPLGGDAELGLWQDYLLRPEDSYQPSSDFVSSFEDASVFNDCNMFGDGVQHTFHHAELSYTEGLPGFPYELPLPSVPEPANIGEDILFLPSESNIMNNTLWQTGDGILGNRFYFIVVHVRVGADDGFRL